MKELVSSLHDEGLSCHHLTKNAAEDNVFFFSVCDSPGSVRMHHSVVRFQPLYWLVFVAV